ncbi:MAG TPA: MlaD family protein [Tepidisphaeraceae bacterium]|jgi:ABC-type transporter Mla subunit MlaD|nr:MlaD family protein [Tepidisphaeraceae bacterium]
MERNAFKAGLFIVISIALIFFVTIMIKGVGRMTEPSKTRTVLFSLADNIGGLRVGDDVRVGGLRVGIIKTINLIFSDKTQKIAIAFTAPARIELHQNAHIVVESTVTGTSDLNIDNLGDGALLADNDSLAGSPSALATILAGAQQIVPLVRDTIGDVKTKTLPKINNTLDKFGGTADTGKEALVQIRDLFGDTKSDFRGTMKNLNSATTTIDQKLPDIMDKVAGLLTKAHTSLDRINVALEDVKTTVANARDISASAKSVIVGNRSKLETMIASLKATADNLKNASAELRHSPWRLLYKPTPAEVANLNIYDTARQFADGASSLDDAASSLRDALKDSKQDPAKIQNLVDQLDKSFQNFNEVEDQLWKSVKE